MTGAGKGTATAPPPSELELPYSDNFDGYPLGQEARYLSDMQGSFEIQPCVSGRPGKCLQLMDNVKPIEWQDDSDAFTLLGDPSWENYTLSVDAILTKPGTVELIGRAGIQERPQSHQQGYYFRVSDGGSWSLFKTDTQGKHTDLAQGSVTPIGIGSWHTYRLSFNHDQIAAYLDGNKVASLTDTPYQTGQVGLGFTDYDTNQFDNLSITSTSHQ